MKLVRTNSLNALFENRVAIQKNSSRSLQAGAPGQRMGRVGAENTVLVISFVVSFDYFIQCLIVYAIPIVPTFLPLLPSVQPTPTSTVSPHTVVHVLGSCVCSLTNPFTFF